MCSSFSNHVIKLLLLTWKLGSSWAGEHKLGICTLWQNLTKMYNLVLHNDRIFQIIGISISHSETVVIPKNNTNVNLCKSVEKIFVL